MPLGGHGIDLVSEVNEEGHQPSRQVVQLDPHRTWAAPTGSILLRRGCGERDGRADVFLGERREILENLGGCRALCEAGENGPERDLVPLMTASPPATFGLRSILSS